MTFAVATILLIFLQCFILSDNVSSLSLLASHNHHHHHHNHQRSLWFPTTIQNTNSPTIILMGGMAQPLAAWEPTARALSTTRNVLLVEPLGVGKSFATTTVVNDQFDGTDHCYYSLISQAQALHQIIMQHWNSTTNSGTTSTTSSQVPPSFDLVGFSLGARILLAYASMLLQENDSNPTPATTSSSGSIHKIHLTGIASERSVASKVAMMGWIDCLQSNKSYGWSMLQTTYSSDFLYKNKDRISQWVNFVEQENKATELLRVLLHDEVDGYYDHYISSLSSLSCRAGHGGQLVVGGADCMAPPEHALQLSRQLGWNDPIILENVGHAVPFECPFKWRKLVLEYLDS